MKSKMKVTRTVESQENCNLNILKVEIESLLCTFNLDIFKVEIGSLLRIDVHVHELCEIISIAF